MDLYYVYELPGCVEDSYAVSEPCVCRARVHKFREAQLLNAAESLKWWRLDNAPHHAFKLVGLKLDQIVKRVANSLALEGHIENCLQPKGS